MAHYRGLDSDQELDIQKVHADTRTVFQQVMDALRDPYIASYVMALCALAPFFVPSLIFVLPPLAVFVMLLSMVYKKNNMLPIHMPQTEGHRDDPNDPKPGQPGKYYKSRGAFMMGNLRKGWKELWLSAQTLLVHVLLLGTTGAGKTETLVSLGANVIAMGSGLIYIDAKAAPKLLFQISTLARMFGRDDDVRVINYITGSQSVKGKFAKRLSNTTNPFAVGSADTAVQTLSSLIPASGGENQIFVDRAVALISAAMPALVELRDGYDFNIYPSLINEYITLKRFVELAGDSRLSESSVSTIVAYLNSLPGYVEGAKPDRQPEEVGRQFGFAQAYFTRALASLSDTYGHVYNVPLAECDFTDIILNSRIMVCLIPAMEKAGEERKSLGKVILSSVRAAMALGLGNKIEGDRQDVLEALPTLSASNVPSMIIVDEYAEVATEGFAITATQGRGLGFSVIFAGQDLAGFYKASEEEADMIFGNTRLKVLMALEDPEKTWSRFEKLAGEAYANQLTGFHGGENGLDAFKRNQEMQVQKTARINLQDLKEQTEGQAHIFMRSDIHRAQIFHHGIPDGKLIKNFRLNRQLQIGPPSDAIVDDFKKAVSDGKYFDGMVKALINGEIDQVTPDIPEALKVVSEHCANGTSFDALSVFTDYCQNVRTLNLEAATSDMDDFGSDDSDIADAINNNSTDDDQIDVTAGTDYDALLGIEQDDEQDVSEITESLYVTENDEESDDGKDVLPQSEIRSIIDETSEWILVEDDEAPMAERIHEDLVEINKICGMSEEVAQSESAETIRGITEAISYPATQPSIEAPEDAEEDLLAAIININNIEKK